MSMEVCNEVGAQGKGGPCPLVDGGWGHSGVQVNETADTLLTMPLNCQCNHIQLHLSL